MIDKVPQFGLIMMMGVIEPAKGTNSEDKVGEDDFFVEILF